MGTVTVPWPTVDCVTDTAIIVQDDVNLQYIYLNPQGGELVPSAATFVVTDAAGVVVLTAAMGGVNLVLDGAPLRLRLLLAPGALPNGIYGYELRAVSGGQADLLADGLLVFGPV